MQEPRRGQRDRLNAALVADATLRRIAGRLTAISLTKPTYFGRLGSWVVTALQSLAGAAAPRPARRRRGMT